MPNLISLNPWENFDLANMPNEVWKDVNGYEGMYRISTYGRIKTMPRPRMAPVHQKEYYLKEKIKHPNTSSGSLIIIYYHNKKAESCRLVKEVAKHFIKNYNGDPIVFKDGNRLNCQLENLIVLTQENVRSLFNKKEKYITNEISQFIRKMGIKRCSHCKIIQNKKEFGTKGIRSRCRKCEREKGRKFDKEQRENLTDWYIKDYARRRFSTRNLDKEDIMKLREEIKIARSNVSM